jgi:hypothetical protein
MCDTGGNYRGSAAPVGLARPIGRNLAETALLSENKANNDKSGGIRHI